MGTHGAGGRFGALFGSVSGAVLQRSPVPVTVVRADQTALRDDDTTSSAR
jgi:nucleotide-binding universal stress UspA family protein